MDSFGESLSPSVLKVLPDDVITDIMTRLPVKSLLRFKCVSKAFCALVDSSYFIRKHHDHAIKSKTNHKIIVNSRDYSYHSIDLDLLDQAIKLEPPFKFDISDRTILGSVHGLLCIQVSTKDIVIWNPTTKKYKKIPEAFSSDIRQCEYQVHGFGYDLGSDDYKIVRINQFWNGDISSNRNKTAVYSLRSNSWQILQDFPYSIRWWNDGRYGSLLRGELLWCVNQSDFDRSLLLIVAFDLATNNFSLVAHPEALNNEFNWTRDKDIIIRELGGDLCLICYHYIDSRVDVWVMRNYRVKESWTKLFSIAKQEISFRYYCPFAYSKKGDAIILQYEHNQLFWYNLKENIARIIKVRDWPGGGIVQMVSCVESLAPPNGSWREE